MSIDKQIKTSPEQLLAMGIADPVQALKNIGLLSDLLGAQDAEILLPRVYAELQRAADPDMALNNLERFMGSLGDVASFVRQCSEQRHILRSLITIFGASRFLSTYLVLHAEKNLAFLSDPGFLFRRAEKLVLSERLTVLMQGETEDVKFFHLLRMFRKQEMLRIGLRDLLGAADLQETVADLSCLAEVCLQRSFAWAEEGLQKRHGMPTLARADGTPVKAGFVVIAMGKLGGQELNFSSDVDLMYVYSADGETEGMRSSDGALLNKITNHQFFIKLAERLSAAIGEKTEDGFVFRVDLRLRPEGQRGPLAQSLGGYEIYYESWGQTWERSALIKARPVAGDAGIGNEFLNRIAPFVYRKYMDFGAFGEIRGMKEKINRDVELKGKAHRDVKLGYGGIREIEFVIQALQLIYGGRDRALREKNALKALHVLSQKGLITYQEHDSLAKAYAFLRMVEHRIQILDDLQSQTMPSDEKELRLLARRAGYFDANREAEGLLRDYAEHTRLVRGIYDDMFAFTGDAEAASTPISDYITLLDAELPEQDAVSQLRKHGFRDPGKAYRNLLLLREGPAFVHQTPRSRKLFNEIFPLLFREIIASTDPDLALHLLESFLAAQGSWVAFKSLVELHASATTVLVAVFANSEYLSRMLISRPVLLINLLESRKKSGTGTSTMYARELSDSLERASDITDKLEALRRFKNQEEIRIGMADLLSGARPAAVFRELSKLAEVCLDAALTLAVNEIAKRFGVEASASGLAVIGAGKLGGRELSYGSDLDIFFVFSEVNAAAAPAGLSVFEYFSKIAEKAISYLSTLTREGFVFRVDTRLRPTGSKGPLVQSIDAVKTYYGTKAETWEQQALLRARCVAGDRMVGREFISSIQVLIYKEQDRVSLARDIKDMRSKMEDEVGREGTTHYNIKQGAGGIVDIEFLIQFLQLMHGFRNEWVRVPGNHNALRALRKINVLTADDYRMLLDAYLFMRKLESRMRIVSNQTTSDLSKNPEKVQLLARRMGYGDDGSPAGVKLLEDYEKRSQQVRSLFIRLVQ